MYSFTNLNNGLSKISVEINGSIENIYLETEKCEQIQNKNLHHITKNNNILFYFYNEEHHRVYLHRFILGVTNTIEHVFFINGNWRDLRPVNLISGSAGSLNNGEFKSRLETLRQEQPPLEAIIQQIATDTVQSAATEQQHQLHYNEESKELIIRNGAKAITISGISEKNSKEIMMELINSHLYNN